MSNSRHEAFEANSDRTPTRTLLSGELVAETMEAAQAAAVGGSEADQAAAMEAMSHAATLPMAEDVQLGEAHCQRCEIVPRNPVGPGTLLVSPPHTHTIGKILSWLNRSRLAHTRDGGVITIDAPPGSLAPVVTPLVDLLSAVEQRSTRVVFRPEGHALQIVDYFNIADLNTFAARVGSGWLLDLMGDNRLTSFFQPIVDCRTGRDVHAHECLLRGEAEGKIISAGPMFEIARRADLVFQLDQAARRAAVAAAARHALTTKVFINFSPNAIYDARSCLASTIRLIDEVGLERSQVVFEVTEAERLPDMEHLKSIIDYYRGRGFGVALDDVGSGYSSLHLLLGLKPDYVKLDMHLIRGVADDPKKAIIAKKLLETIGELGFKSVAEGVETRAEWDWVREHGADYAQGYLFAKPAPSPPIPAPAAA